MRKDYTYRENGIRVTMIGDLKFLNGEDLLKRNLKNPAFRKAYEKAGARRKLQNQLREARIAKRLTQKKVAERADVPQSVIARIESGEKNMTLETLLNVARAVGKELQLV